MFDKQKILTYSGLTLFFLIPSQVSAQGLDTIAANIGASTVGLPGMVAGLSYLSGVLFAVLALFKTIDHVSNPSQTPLRVPVVRFLVGGALFALPTIFAAAQHTINGGSLTNFDPDVGVIGTLSSLVGLAAYANLGSFNSILNSIIFTSGNLPALVSVVAYLLGLIIAVSALYKTRDHVDDPDRNPLKDAVIRYLTAGALFALPTVYEAAYNTIADGGMGLGSTAIELFLVAGFFNSTEVDGGLSECGISSILPSWLSTPGVGSALCNAFVGSTAIPHFLIMVSYMLGLIFGLWAILKIRDHVINPQQTALSEGIMRLIASGAFFGLPVIAVSLAWSFTPSVPAVVALMGGTNSGFEDGGVTLVCVGPNNPLHEALACFMGEILGPIHIILNFFGFCAGLIFIMIGISRLIKSSQDGARAPGGLGTVGTFVTGALLISSNIILAAFGSSFFGTPISHTKAKLTYTTGMSVAEQAAAYQTINAVLKFMIIIGMISFVRGIFILRDVAEGNQQASSMSGITHIVGGALAVNLGPVLNAVQTSLGISAFGVTFGT